MTWLNEKRWVFGRRYLYRVAWFAIAALAFSWLATHTVKTTYKAETILAFKSTSYPVSFDLLDLLDNRVPLFIEDEIYSLTFDMPSVLTSVTVAEKVLDRDGLRERLYDPEEDEDYSEWLDQFRAHLKFKISQDFDTITIAYTAETPELAEEITRIYAEEFEGYFSRLYWHLSLADAIQVVVDRHVNEINELAAIVNAAKVEEIRPAVKKSATKDVDKYLLAEKAKLIARAQVLGYELALERIDEELGKARGGESFEMPREALRDYVLTYLKAVYYVESQRVTELETEVTPDYPELRFWNEARGVTSGLIERASGGALNISYNSIVVRAIEAKARFDFWTERAKQLEIKVAEIPQFEYDVTWALRKMKFLEIALYYWEKHLAMQRMGEDFADDPFVVLDDPIVPETAYYPIIDMWVYAFPVLLTIGTMMFLLRTKIEDETLLDISEERFK
jgi:hypothetical protein